MTFRKPVGGLLGFNLFRNTGMIQVFKLEAL